MKYEKPSLTLDEQVQLLRERGMEGDPGLMAERLAVVSYYRLSGYWFPFRMQDDAFQPGTSFNTIWRRYVFDRQLRLLVMDAIERFEVGLRTQLAYHHSLTFGPFAYATERLSRPKMSRSDFAGFISGLLAEIGRSKEPFIKHFYQKYGEDHDVPPFWEAVEVMSFGAVVTFYKTTTHHVKQSVATAFGVPATVMESWLLALNTIRNICAHHSRLWNRELGNKPMIPHDPDYPDWHLPVQVRNERIFGILTVCKHTLNHIAPQSGWADRLIKLLDGYPDVPLASMGFPENWQQCPIWKH